MNPSLAEGYVGIGRMADSGLYVGTKSPNWDLASDLRTQEAPCALGWEPGAGVTPGSMSRRDACLAVEV